MSTDTVTEIAPDIAPDGAAIRAMAARVDRYQGLLSPATLKQIHVAVIGVGAVGRQAAIQLAAMGVGHLTIVDFDRVEPHNMGPQGYWPKSLGKFKISELAEELRWINPELDLIDVQGRFMAAGIKGTPYVLSCVDNMDVRKEILEAACADMLDLRLYAEGRMAAEQCVASYVTDEESKAEWLKGWYPPAEAHTEGCTAKSTIYCASYLAAMLVSGVSKRIRGIELPYSAYMNMLSLDMDVKRRVDKEIAVPN